jgi:hypothetical protein
MHATKVFATHGQVTDRLVELGLDEAVLVQAIRRGFAAWASCTPNHPALLPGILAWGETVSALREQLSQRGWQRSDEGNLPLVINRAGSISISVATGDESTGRSDDSPCTKASKGPKTADAVAVNQHQLSLFPHLAPLPSNLLSQKDRTLWFLLIHRDVNAREMRCELSRPINMNPEGRVDGWVERIVLGTLPFGGDMVDIPHGNDLGPDLVVEIARRG